MMELVTFILCLGLAGFFLGVAPHLPKEKTWARTLVIGIGFVLTIRYLWWRFFETVLPARLIGLEGAWFIFIFVSELFGFFNQFLCHVVLTRVADRSGEADRYEAELRATPADKLPGVDVFVCTYNEGLDVVERTIVAALALDYPRFTVWVLDDGNRDWLRDFCAEKGAKYVRRKEHTHAKAGNINHALKITHSDLFAVLDADFVPFRNFLYRTVGFFRDPKVGMVQTPHHFFNPDPIQLNLGLSHTWPNDQRFFFDVILPSRDAWDCAWCCGSCSVQRRDIIESVGGVPTDSITEDLLSTIVLLRKGYVTRYLNERLTMGLSAENLDGYFKQRERWCRGNLQTMFLRSGPLSRGGLSILKRFLFLPLDWVINPFARLLAIIIPIVYLWTGTSPFLIPSIEELLCYQLPLLFAIFGAIRWIAPDSYMPFLSTASSLFNSFRIAPTGLATFLKPFGTPFRVTPKGSSITFGFGDRMILGMALALIVLTVGGIVKNRVAPAGLAAHGAYLLVAEVWAVMNVIVLALVALIAIESPRPRREERFPCDELASYRVGAEVHTCRVRNLSVSGALLEVIAERKEKNGKLLAAGAAPPALPDTSPLLGEAGDVAFELTLDGAGAFPAQVVRTTRTGVGVQFAGLTSPDRDRLIHYIYASGRDNAVQDVRGWNIVGGLLKNLVRE
jgi:cellulose synthase (UDP-forming)